METLHGLMQKNAVEPVTAQKSLDLSCSKKTNNQVETYLGPQFFELGPPFSQGSG